MPNVSDTDSGQAGDGVYEGEIPTFPSRTRIVFYIEAVDEQGNARRFPPEAPAKTCLYMVEAPIDVPFDLYHLVLDTARLSELSRRPVHSNELVDATFVYNNKEVFYGVSVRYRGSPWGRASKNNFRVRFPRIEHRDVDHVTPLTFRRGHLRPEELSFQPRYLIELSALQIVPAESREQDRQKIGFLATTPDPIVPPAESDSTCVEGSLRKPSSPCRWRIAGALAYPGYTLSDQTVGNILKRPQSGSASERRRVKSGTTSSFSAQVSR